MLFWTAQVPINTTSSEAGSFYDHASADATSDPYVTSGKRGSEHDYLTASATSYFW